MRRVALFLIGNLLLHDDAAIGVVVAVPMYMNFNPGTLRLPVA